ncbi:heavy metal-binding protein HIP-like [Ruditapes philippinarum]|uniref:heavy metal-binding protein HIP-like n=1 Tax=Ruditapes philippinarum TaxID=129788 RepID=UPI00295C16B8|nr:heavy metal-binding protein HIP-like [Ruditapes philippinarum]
MACNYSLDTIVFLTVLCYSTASEPDIEPDCLKFKYDKQMLETMVRIEAKMNQWDKEKENFKENMLELRKAEMKREFAKQNEQIGQILDDYKKIREELNYITAQFEKVAGNFTKTPKIAFNAYTRSGRNYDNVQTIVFPDVLLNEGGGYDKITGMFTAPVTGLYYFSVHICHEAAKFVVAAIVHGHTRVAVTSEYETLKELVARSWLR